MVETGIGSTLAVMGDVIFLVTPVLVGRLKAVIV